MKECIIILFVIILVTIASIYSQKYLEKTADSLLSKLEELKELLKSKTETNTQNLLAQDIYREWQNLSKNWSILIMHEELDLIELSVLGMKASIEESSDEALTELEKSMYLIGHIKEKENFKLKNIF